MPITTRLTEALNIAHPIISAPMAFAAGGELAAAISGAGALGLIGGGYGDEGWIREQFALAQGARVGCGFITWAVADRPGLIDMVLGFEPAAVFLSFGDPAPLAGRIRESGAKLICQIQTLEDARRAIACKADIIVAQGGEAGGHGQSRGTLSLVPEIADLLKTHAPDTLLCAAGGIVDGRGLAASLMLGADGIVMGSRLWATSKALVHPNMHAAALAADGDQTIRSSVMDIVRGRNWPSRFTARVLKNDFTERWHGREPELRDSVTTLGPQWDRAWREGDVTLANTFVGEGVGLIDEIPDTRAIIGQIAGQAEDILRNADRSYLTD